PRVPPSGRSRRASGRWARSGERPRGRSGAGCRGGRCTPTGPRAVGRGSDPGAGGHTASLKTTIGAVVTDPTTGAGAAFTSKGERRSKMTRALDRMWQGFAALVLLREGAQYAYEDIV